MADDKKAAQAAPLSGELREYALSLPRESWPKNLTCEGCVNPLFDAWKLLCCNKPVCSSCQSRLSSVCPFCKHEPLEADGSSVSAPLRNTMRIFLQKLKKKEANKPVAADPVATPPQPSEAADKPVEGSEERSKVQPAADGQAAVVGDDDEHDAQSEAAVEPGDPHETSASPKDDEAKHQEEEMSQPANQDSEPTSAVEEHNAGQTSLDGTADGMLANNPMFAMGGASGNMMGQFGFNQTPGNFNNMGWNIPNMMGNAAWNGVNPMGMFPNMMNTTMPGMPNMSNSMYGGYGGNMGMPGMTDMSSMNMGYGNGFGNEWQGQMNGAGYNNYDGGFNATGGYNQSGAQYPQMMNFQKNSNQDHRFQHQGGAHNNHKNYGRNNGNFSGRQAWQNPNSRPGSRSGGDQNGSDAAQRDERRDEQSNAEDATAARTEGKVDEFGRRVISPSSDAPEAIDPSTEDTARPVDLTLAGNDTHTGDGSTQSAGLNKIQTVESVEEPDTYNDEGTDGQYNANMGYGNGGYGSRGGYNTAYGAATVLTGEPVEPKGLGVAGAPTGPRAMREGLPNVGYSSRIMNERAKYPTHSQPPSAPARHPTEPPTSEDRTGKTRTPEQDARDRSPSRAKSADKRDDYGDDYRDDYHRRSVSPDRRQDEKYRNRPRSRTPDDRRKDSKYHQSSRYEYDQDDCGDYQRENEYVDQYYDDKEDRYRDDREDREDAGSMDSKHRSRRDKDKSRSSRSHRDRSREHRRRHHSRSRSPAADKYEDEEGYGNGTDGFESNGRRKSRTEKYRDRERSRDRDRDRRERRDYEYEKEKEKDRARDKDRDRKRSRRDREDDGEDHRSSRRSRKEKEREKDREYEREREREKEREYEFDDRRSSRENIQPAVRASSPPIDAPTGPAADQGFSIRGRSKAQNVKPIVTPMPPPPPSAPRAFKPPTGPAADRDRDRDRGGRDNGHSRRRSSASVSMPSTPLTPTTPAVEVDHYAQERERKDRERLAREHGLHGRSSTSGSAQHSSSRQSLPNKRSREDFEPAATESSRDRGRDRDNSDMKPPSGPAAHREKRRRGTGQDTVVPDLIMKGLRKQAGDKKRRGGVKTEGEAKADIERAERERERRR